MPKHTKSQCACARGGAMPARARGGAMAHKRGLGGDIGGFLGNMFLPGVGGQLGQIGGNALGSWLGFKRGGPIPPRPMYA